MRRDDPKQKTYFRSSERVFRMNELWYFTSREGDQGPFSDEAQARSEVARYIVEKTELAAFQQNRESKSKVCKLPPKRGVLANVQSANLTVEMPAQDLMI